MRDDPAEMDWRPIVRHWHEQIQNTLDLLVLTRMHPDLAAAWFAGDDATSEALEPSSSASGDLDRPAA